LPDFVQRAKYFLASVGACDENIIVIILIIVVTEKEGVFNMSLDHYFLALNLIYFI